MHIFIALGRHTFSASASLINVYIGKKRTFLVSLSLFWTEDARLSLRSSLVRRWAVGVLGIWKGEGLGEGWDKGGQFTSNLRPRWTDPVTARRVLSK